MAINKALIDTNICIDAGLYRKPFAANALEIIERSQFGEFLGVIAAHSLDTIFYILNDVISKKDSYNILNELRRAFDVSTVNQTVIDSALRLRWPDFEDAIHYESARAAGCEAIVTRNLKDFSQSKLPLYSPREFLDQLDQQ